LGIGSTGEGREKDSLSIRIALHLVDPAGAPGTHGREAGRRR
jgi:hypothetical protein